MDDSVQADPLDVEKIGSDAAIPFANLIMFFISMLIEMKIAFQLLSNR